MKELIKSDTYQLARWKNGKGLTREIAIFPKTASMQKNDFLWRISSAEVAKGDPFSPYPECDRKLIVWKGEGLSLNGKLLLPNNPISFSGEEFIQCEPIEHIPVADVGIIYKKKYINAELKVHQINLPTTLSLANQTVFLFLASGKECSINDVNLEMGDTIKIENEKSITIQSKYETSIIIYQINISDLIFNKSP